MATSGEREATKKAGRKYDSYLVRHWRWTDGSQRLAVEHVQSGSQTIVASPADAIAWIGDHEPTCLGVATGPDSSVRGHC